MSTISAAHLESTVAERRSTASTSGPGSPLQESAALRKTAGDKLSRSQRDFDRKNQRHTQKLEKLSKELEKLNLTHLSEKVKNVLLSCWGTPPGLF